jgi:DNA-binding response OmpR family regulator
MATKRRKILLLVDDDRDQLCLRKIILEMSGYEVLTATNARSGMHLFESHDPDAVILDYEMPAVNGETLAGWIRNANPYVPILMLSGCVSLPSSARELVDTVVSKNTAPSFLLSEIELLTQQLEPWRETAFALGG